MIDPWGRRIDYLRLSITDRCNLRCLYCMPEEGVNWKPHGDMLSFEEILRLCRILGGLGIRKIKVTGGEPLVRKGASSLVKALKETPPLEQVTLTTNGILLKSFLEELGDVVIDGVNISLDALNEEHFARISRKGGLLSAALASLEAALERGIRVKINCVPMRGVNDGDLPAVAALARDRPVMVRFIEMMPLGAAASLAPLSGPETRAILERAFGPLSPWEGEAPGNGPALYYTVPGFKGGIGFIDPMSCGFCGDCNRLRLSSSGFLKPCLSSEAGGDLKALLRGGAPDKEIVRAIEAVVAGKPRAHNFSMQHNCAQPGSREGMFRIGG